MVLAPNNWFFLIIGLRHKLVFWADGNRILDLLFDDKRLYQLS